jgi:hypothetical protein
MFQKYRSYLMIVVGMALAALVWLDNRPEPAPAGKSIAVVQAKLADETPPATQGETLEAGEGEPQGGIAPNAAAGLALTNPLSSLAREEFSDWVARPLFAPSRKRPPEKAGAPAQAAAPAQVASYELLGIVREGPHALALLRNKVDGASLRVEIGDVVGGWRIAKIERAAVVLERGEGLAQTLPLQR